MSDADVGRKAFSLRRNIALFQESFTVIEKVSLLLWLFL